MSKSWRVVPVAVAATFSVGIATCPPVIAAAPPVVVRSLVPGLEAEPPTARRDAAAVLSPGARVRVPVGFAASSVGVTWNGSGGSLLLRSHGPTGWSRWVELAAEDEHGDEVRTVQGAGPVWTGRGTDEVELTVRGAPVSGVEVHAVPDTALASTAAPTAYARPVAPGAGGPITPTEAWGSTGWSESNCPGGPRASGPIDLAVVHHTATSSSYSPSDVPAILRSIQAFHIRTRGWCDIAYNFLVDRFGRVWEGRVGGPLPAIRGGHAMGFNTGSVGISVIGDFNATTLPAAAASAVSRIAWWKLGINGLRSTGRFTKVSRGSSSIPEGQQVVLERISGHRDVSSTSCPGASAYGYLGSIRSRAASFGPPPAPFLYGTATDRFVAADFDGNGVTDAGVRRGNGFMVRTSLTAGSATTTFFYGTPTDTVLFADWNGDGRETPAVYRSGYFLIRNSNTSGPADRVVLPAGTGLLDVAATPLGGDWNGDGVATVGLRRGRDITLYDDTSAAVVSHRVQFGRPEDLPFVGDADGDGDDEIHLQRGTQLYISDSIRAGSVPDGGELASASVMPFIADWTGLGLPGLGTVDARRWTPATPPSADAGGTDDGGSGA